MTPESLKFLLYLEERTESTSVPILSGENGQEQIGKKVLTLFTGFVDIKPTKVYAIENPWRFAVERCGPFGFYGTTGASVDLNQPFPC